MPYVGRDVLSKGELAFYNVLQSVVKETGVVFCQVSLSALMKVESMSDRSRWQSAFNKINSKSIDFVVCDPRTMQTMVAIELDDKSHRQQSRIDRDALLDEICAAAGVPLLHVRAARSYNPAELQQQIKAAMND